MTAKRLGEKHKLTSDPASLPVKRTRSNAGSSFDWLHQCLYCGSPCSIIADPMNPTRWVPEYPVRENEGKANDDITEMATVIEGRIEERCHGQGDDWAEDVLDRLAVLAVRSADHHASDARYHRECYITN